MAEGTIATARRRRGAVRGRLTRTERDIAKLEGKSSLSPSDQRKIKRLMEHVKEDDREFEERHLEVLSFIKEEDKDAIDAEEKVYDEFGIQVMELLERLEQLEPVEESESRPTAVPNPSSLTTAVADPSHSLIKRL